MAASSRLLQVARRSTEEREAALERCELCGEPIPSEHRHVLEVATRDLRCACRACAILFDRPAAAEGRYKLVRDRRLRITDLELDDVMWEQLRLPVDMAFFFHASTEDRVVAYYPSPMGPTESLLDLSAWEDLATANPVLRTLDPDVEALLVNRVRGARQHWIVPIDECYALVGLIRAHWRGLTGGAEVWQEIARNFDRLDRRARPASRNDEES
jgi:Family of unknown function (DUF5947)